MEQQDASLRILEQAGAGARRRLWAATALGFALTSIGMIAFGVGLDALDPSAAVGVTLIATGVAVAIAGLFAWTRIRPARQARIYPWWLPPAGLALAGILRPVYGDSDLSGTLMLALATTGNWVVVAIMLRRLRAA